MKLKTIFLNTVLWGSLVGGLSSGGKYVYEEFDRQTESYADVAQDKALQGVPLTAREAFALAKDRAHEEDGGTLILCLLAGAAAASGLKKKKGTDTSPKQG